MIDSEILLTGATGMVGPHVLAGLLERSDKTVACLTRDGTAELGLARIVRTLELAGYKAASLAPRIRAIPGNLALPRFGLSESSFVTLAGAIKHVVHNAAWLGEKEKFSVEALTNVSGTTSVVELCLRANARLDHVSTIGVLRWTSEDKDGWLQESVWSAPPKPPQDEGAYAYYFSKWMAEQLALYASEKVSVTVHRLCDIFSRDGDGPLAALVGAVAALGTLPDDDALSWSQHSISDFHAGHSVASIALRPASGLRVLHNVGYVDGISVADVKQAFAARGVTLGAVPAEDWMRRIKAELPWVPMLTDWQLDYLLMPKHANPRFANAAFKACLAECGLVIPTAAERLAPVVANTVPAT